jgi:hypothetical protein
MSTKRSPIADDVVKLFEAAWIDLPVAAAKRLLEKDEGAVREAGWKAYDAWVRLANDAANQVYGNPAFGTVAGRGIEAVLRVQRVGEAVASAIFGNLWPAIGLPTASELQALRDDVTALREELRAARIEASEEQTAGDGYEAARGAEAENAAAAVIWNGFKPGRKRSARENKKSVAL